MENSSSTVTTSDKLYARIWAHRDSADVDCSRSTAVLKSYEAIFDHGTIRWLDTPPAVEEARLIITVLPGKLPDVQNSVRHRHPPESMKGKMHIVGDIVESPYSEDEWESMFDYTSRQLEDGF